MGAMVAMVGFGLATAPGGSGSRAGGRGAPALDPASSPAAARSTAGDSAVPALDRSAPVRMRIPSIDVRGKLVRLHLRADRSTLRLPRDPHRAGWFTGSATPGEVGPTVVVGYIDAGPRGPGVFRRLARLDVGDRAYLTRRDGVIVAYRVDEIESYRPAKLPIQRVYGRGDRPALRLVTCGGALHHEDRPTNVVVYGHQVEVSR